MSKKNKKKFEFKFHVINLKIHSDSNDKQNLYFEALNKILKLDNFFVNIGNKNGLVLKTIERVKFDNKQLEDLFEQYEYPTYEILVCDFIKFRIEDEKDNYYDISKKSLKPGDPNSTIKPNAFKIPFYFIPSIHRIFLPISSKISPVKAKMFFEKALLELYLEKQYFNVEITKSHDEINRIYKFSN